MKNPESWETQLRSWVPRQPSLRIKAHLFARGGKTPACRVAQGWLDWHNAWPAAFAASLIALLTIVNVTRLAGFGVSSGPVTFTVAALSNMTSVELQHNCVSAPIFGWTSDRQLHSPRRSFDLLNTNHLLR